MNEPGSLRCRRFHPNKDDGHCVLNEGHELPHRCEPKMTEPAEWFGDERDNEYTPTSLQPCDHHPSQIKDGHCAVCEQDSE